MGGGSTQLALGGLCSDGGTGGVVEQEPIRLHTCAGDRENQTHVRLPGPNTQLPPSPRPRVSSFRVDIVVLPPPFMCRCCHAILMFAPSCCFLDSNNQIKSRLLLCACNGRTEYRALKIWVWRYLQGDMDYMTNLFALQLLCLRDVV